MVDMTKLAEETNGLEDIDLVHNSLESADGQEGSDEGNYVFCGELINNELFNPIPIFHNATGDIPGSEVTSDILLISTLVKL